ncbi:MAG: hypothetical protein AAF298_09110 [Cyanobacteria bacterium P01_A01_bin.40]
MKSKLTFSPASKIFVSFSLAIAAVLMGIEAWQNYHYRTAFPTPWKVTEVNSGESFTVARQGEIETITLCGVEGIDGSSRQFLTSTINMGDGTVVLEQVGDTYEAWILLERDYDVELVKHFSSTPNDLIGQQIHLNTWVIEHGFSRLNQENSDQCLQPEHLTWVEQVAKKSNVGIFGKTNER